MKTLEHFNDFCVEITSNNSRNYKLEVLRKYRNDEVIKTYLNFCYNPFITTGISSKKLNRRVRPDDWYRPKTIFDLLDYLKTHNTGRDEDISTCHEMIFVVGELDPDLEVLLTRIICKDLSLGCDVKTINQVIPNLLPQFSCMLSNKYFDRPERVEGNEFVLTTKIDGGRIIVIKENGQISFFTRTGLPYEGLVELEHELKTCNLDNFVFDGEITVSDYETLDSKTSYKNVMKITRSDGEKRGVVVLVFDYMTPEEFRTQNCPVPYIERQTRLTEIFQNYDFKFFKKLPILYRGTDTSKIMEYLDSEISRGQEGVMINMVQSPYSFKRTDSLLKVKRMDTLDLQIVGFEEGSGRLSGTLGKIVVRYKNNNTVGVGSGFTDWLRHEIWNNRDKYLNKIVEISYFCETTNSDGTNSLRFPIFKNFRDSLDKTTPDF